MVVNDVAIVHRACPHMNSSSLAFVGWVGSLHVCQDAVRVTSMLLYQVVISMS